MVPVRVVPKELDETNSKVGTANVNAQELPLLLPGRECGDWGRQELFGGMQCQMLVRLRELRRQAMYSVFFNCQWAKVVVNASNGSLLRH